mgnify:CR=1 FL=1
MKFYFVKHYNKQGQYCSHSCLALADSENIADFNEPEDQVELITRDDFDSHSRFYHFHTDATKKEEQALRKSRPQKVKA